nr:MAG TPA: hypothetical protein [Caudoviricetes sp.]
MILGGKFKAHRFFCVQAVSKFGHFYIQNNRKQMISLLWKKTSIYLFLFRI